MLAAPSDPTSWTQAIVLASAPRAITHAAASPRIDNTGNLDTGSSFFTSIVR
jgi:hypothetical protein